jgi:hypothetical protein
MAVSGDECDCTPRGGHGVFKGLHRGNGWVQQSILIADSRKQYEVEEIKDNQMVIKKATPISSGEEERNLSESMLHMAVIIKLRLAGREEDFLIAVRVISFPLDIRARN